MIGHQDQVVVWRVLCVELPVMFKILPVRSKASWNVKSPIFALRHSRKCSESLFSNSLGRVLRVRRSKKIEENWRSGIGIKTCQVFLKSWKKPAEFEYTFSIAFGIFGILVFFIGICSGLKKFSINFPEWPITSVPFIWKKSRSHSSSIEGSFYKLNFQA